MKKYTPLILILSGLAMLITACTSATVAAAPSNPHTELAALLADADVTPLDPGPSPDPAMVDLGRALFWDPLLSGNRDIACATCHHADFASGDALAISVGTGGLGLGPDRVNGDRRTLVPRNATELFNRGAPEWDVMFWDGRVMGSVETGFDTPASYALPDGLDSVLAAQAMFPITSRDEMRGTLHDRDIFGERNELAQVSDSRWEDIWGDIMDRVLAVPEYVDLFATAYPDIPTDDLGFEHAANALAAYQIKVFTFTDAPWDRYLSGDASALTEAQVRGATLFYGDAGCADCHGGPLMTDQAFHNLGVPNIGPGKDPEEPLDSGRLRETGADCDRYAFRTPPLRNVTITGPYMHNGAYVTLEDAIRHHLDPVTALANFDPTQLTPELRESYLDNTLVNQTILDWRCDPLPEPMTLTDAQMADLLAFMEALTSPSAVDLSHLVPDSVPSGLEVGGR